MAKVVVIGGTGQISASVTDQLVAQGHDVVVMTRGRSARPIPEGVEHVTCDRSDTEGFERTLDDVLSHGADAVIDMICFQPEQTEQMVRILRGKVKQYILCSTVCVYGGHLATIPAQEDDPLRPVSPYGRNKAACEEVAFTAHRQGDLGVTVVRPPYTLGPGGHLDSIWGRDPYLVDRIRRGKPVLILDSGNNLWHASAASDVAAVIVGAVGNSQALGEAFNAVGPKIYTHREYFEAIGTALGHPVYLVPIPTEIFLQAAGKEGGFVQSIFQYHTAFSTEKAQRLLGVTPRVYHEEAVRIAVDYLDAHGLVGDSSTTDRDERMIQLAEGLRRYALDAI